MNLTTLKMRPNRGLPLAACAVAAALLMAPRVSGQEKPKPDPIPQERYTGFAINTNNGPKTGVLNFAVERWSTDEERSRLLSIVKSEKDSYRANEEMVKVIQKMPKVGWIRSTTSLSWELRYARQEPLEDGGRRVVLATDRPIGFWEVNNQTRTMEYPLTIIEIRFDKSGKGKGKILAGTKLYLNKDNNIVIEHWENEPIRFNEITRVK